MRTALILCTLVASTSIASAESLDAAPAVPRKHAYVAAGAELGVQRSFMSGGYFDVGWQLGTSHAYARTRLAIGESGSGGNYEQARFGIEGRACVARDWLCGFTGVDVGFQHDKVVRDGADTDYMVSSEGLDALAVPRVGVEVGKGLRARFAFDVPLTMRVDSGRTGAGAALSAGLGYTF